MTDSTVLDDASRFVSANDRQAGLDASYEHTAPLLFAVSGGALKEIMQAAGYRVDVLPGDGIVVLRSATGGLGFEIRLVNSVGSEGRYADATFLTHFSIEGTFPHELLNRWNKSRRFARLFLDRPEAGGDFLVLSCDLSFAGGVSPDHVRAHVQIWDVLVHQLVAWLREELPKVAPTVAGTDGSGPLVSEPASDGA
jgi:hypothetical protein